MYQWYTVPMNTLKGIKLNAGYILVKNIEAVLRRQPSGNLHLPT